jgi:DNA-binding winged helix-turn-helix (wHTH) protein
VPTTIGDSGVSEPREMAGSLIRFDTFELDFKECQLRRKGSPVDLPPQPLKILIQLTGRPGALVTRKEIRAVLWPGEAAGDFDARLNFAVKKLREALGDDAERPRYIQTARNAGYRFIAPVQRGAFESLGQVNQVGTSAPDPLSESSRRPENSSSGKRPHSGPNGWFLFVVAISMVALAATVVFELQSRGPSRSRLADLRTQPTAPSAEAEFKPSIFSVTPILPHAKQRIVISGRGFGFHTPYANSDSAYLAIRDITANWAGGRIIPQNWDEVMLDVESWTDTEIVVSGFSGSYGLHGWKLAAGDELEIAIWNPQSGAGPELYSVHVSKNTP